MVEILNALYDNDYTSSALLRHYGWVTNTITRLEEEIERHREELHENHEYMMGNPRFQATIQPVVMTFRRKTRKTRPLPYQRPPTDPSTSSTRRRSPPFPIVNDPLKRSPTPFPIVEQISRPPSPRLSSSTESLLSYYTAPEESLGTRKDNPINVDEIEDGTLTICSRCYSIGHLREDCDTPMRSFDHCEICAWTKQEICDHVDVSPAWIKRQQERIKRRT